MHTESVGCLGSYRDLIRSFLDAGYQSVFFDELRSAQRDLILRHDIDFDCQAALSLARTEFQLGVKATYFFLVSSDSYNLFSPPNRDSVKEIARLGHRIEIHFDPTVYTDTETGLAQELMAFEAWFGVKARIISIHRPSPDFLQNSKILGQLEHTYLPKYFSDIAYISDSRGAFRFGHPLASRAFQEARSLQLLTHPIWWVLQGGSNEEVLSRMMAERDVGYREHVSRNCTPVVTHS